MHKFCDSGLKGGNHVLQYLCKPRVLSPLRSLRVRNEVDLVPLVCEDGPPDPLPCFVMLFSLAPSRQGREIFTLNVFLLPCVCLCSASLPNDSVGRSATCVHCWSTMCVIVAFIIQRETTVH